jgi:hypothetical protein
LISITHGCKLFGSSWVDKHVKIWWNGWVPYGQSSSRICHIGNHHISLWMMPIRTLNIRVSCILVFNFLFHSFMFSILC